MSITSPIYLLRRFVLNSEYQYSNNFSSYSELHLSSSVDTKRKLRKLEIWFKKLFFFLDSGSLWKDNKLFWLFAGTRFNIGLAYQYETYFAILLRSQPSSLSNNNQKFIEFPDRLKSFDVKGFSKMTTCRKTRSRHGNSLERAPLHFN